MVAAVLSIAEAMNLETVAEGVENLDQSRALADLGCSTGQGFLFARPGSLAEVVAHRRLAVPRQRTRPAKIRSVVSR
jgi:EAL domain-containing protein (putative c-di-GMP-specific phosphodiesterase class I)